MNLLHDVVGPQARRRTAVLEVGGYALLVILGWVAVARLAAHGELSTRAWEPFTEPGLWRLLGEGLLNNVRAAAAGMMLSLSLGILLALALLAPTRAIRWPARVLTEFFRSVPLLLLLYFTSLVLPAYGLRLSDFWFLTLALTVYNMAVIADIVRAGVLALPRGQSEGALALGFSPFTAMRLVILPQAIRAMSPALVSQLVILLKGTALAYVLGGYVELLRSATIVGQYFTRSALQALMVAAVLFMLVNLALSGLARLLERRQRRRYGLHTVARAGVELATVPAVTR
ncbi:amino acid ABC transporter permease [Dactylosporangium darangshiense]|uniref:Amino acid ABC transporter permease n=1 Tax=Dactylosporangium darangshiense TaxID=579108 RepID=A0ABP8DTI2_9ACTN